MDIKTLRAVFTGCSYCKTRPLTRQDYGIVLQFVHPDLPETYQVHFSNSKENSGTAKTQIATADGVTIPNEYLIPGKSVYAWAFLQADGAGRSRCMVEIPVASKPTVTDAPPTPQQRSAIDEAISALNEGVERTEEAEQHYPRIVDGYWQVWDAEARTWVNTGVKAIGEDGAPGRDGADGQDGTPGVTYTPTVSAAGEISWTNDGGLPNPQPRNIIGPQGETGPQGPKGEKGEKGDPGEVTQTEFDELSGDVSNLKSAVDYLEDYAYTNVVNKTVVFQSNPFIALDTTLRNGNTYQINLQFKNITNNNLSKMTAIRLYVIGSSTSEYEDIKFSVAYNQMQENIVYSAFVTLSIDATCILIGFNSAASFSTDNVVINVNDIAVKFANKNVESISNNAFEALKKTIGFEDIHFTNGYYQKTDGTIAELASFMVSDFVPVIPGLSMAYFMHGYNNVASICIFKSDQLTVTRNVHVAVESDLEGNLTFEDGEAYVRFCRWSTSKGSGDTLSMPTIMNVDSEVQRIDREISVIGETQWQGKIWHCFGTSISDTSQVGKYPPYLAALSGLQHVNFGYSGGTMINHILAAIKGDANIANADLITVEGFVNDWSQQSPLGTITDTTADTFCGAIYDAITYILSHSNATLVFITDTTGQNYNNIDLRRQAVRNGKTQHDFIQATVDMCNYMGVPVIDAGRKSCISQDTATLYLADQIHQTKKGGEQYARTIWAELKNIKPRIV